MILERLDVPIVLAPLAGGPTTPELAAAVSSAGGLGFLAAGYLTADAMAETTAAARRLTDRPLGMNVFAAGEPTDAAAFDGFVSRLETWAAERGLPLGAPRFDDDQFEDKVEILANDPVAVVSFTFGCPAPKTIRRLQAAGSEVWVTITDPQEAALAARAGADALVVQGIEAGGHRGSFTDGGDSGGYGLLSLVQLLADRETVPHVAAGGIATGRGVAAALAAGAAAVQIGSAFLLADEAGTAEAHREALASDRETALTRAFTGRLARGVVNEFMAEHGPYAPSAYPEIHHMTAPMRKAARERGDGSLINLWAGQTHQLARRAPAARIVAELIAEATESSAGAARRLAG